MCIHPFAVCVRCCLVRAREKQDVYLQLGLMRAKLAQRSRTLLLNKAPAGISIASVFDAAPPATPSRTSNKTGSRLHALGLLGVLHAFGATCWFQTRMSATSAFHCTSSILPLIATYSNTWEAGVTFVAW